MYVYACVSCVCREEVSGQGELYRELVEHLGVRGVQVPHTPTPKPHKHIETALHLRTRTFSNDLTLVPSCPSLVVCQAFVYRGALSQLERLANHFLSLLADASLRLQLSLDGDRVHKSVRTCWKFRALIGRTKNGPEH